jgi:hypothetical protein
MVSPLIGIGGDTVHCRLADTDHTGDPSRDGPFTRQRVSSPSTLPTTAAGSAGSNHLAGSMRSIP